MRFITILLSFVISLFILIHSTPSTVMAQEMTDDEMEISFFELEEFFNQTITVASKKALTLRESPGIVSAITKEEIRNSGARDLIDVL